MQTIELVTSEKIEFLNITPQVRSAILHHPSGEGVLTIFVPHTTAGITINESADPSVEHDVAMDLLRLVPRTQKYYQHYEGNSDAHTMATLVGSSVQVIVDNRELVLGKWQGIFFCEFDGPRTRKVFISP